MKIILDGPNILPKNIRGKHLLHIFEDLLDALESHCKENLNVTEAKDFFVSVTKLESKCIAAELKGSDERVFNLKTPVLFKTIDPKGSDRVLSQDTYDKLEAFRKKSVFHGMELFSVEENTLKNEDPLTFNLTTPFRKESVRIDPQETYSHEDIIQSFKLVGILDNGKDKSKITLRPIEGKDITTVVSDKVFEYTKKNFGRWFDVWGDKLIHNKTHKVERILIRKIQLDPNGEYFFKNVLPTIKKRRIPKSNKDTTSFTFKSLLSGTA